MSILFRYALVFLGLILAPIAGASSAGESSLIGEASSYASELWTFVFEPQAVTGDVMKEPFASPLVRDLLIAAFLFIFVFFSEDLACIAGGILAAAGTVSLGGAILGCFLGIFVSDVLLYWLGRILGDGAFKLGFVKRAAEGGGYERFQRACDKSVFKIVFLTRFIPGSRVIAYVSAGALKVQSVRFTLSLGVAALIWTPILVAIAYFAGRPLIEWWERSGIIVLPMVALGVIVLYLGITLLVQSFTYRGRRKIRGRWVRLTQWEFWPALPVYLPVLFYSFWLAIRYRSWTVWAACNPGMQPLSGLAMESKSEILSQLNEDADSVADWIYLDGEQDLDSRIEALNAFRQSKGLSWPIVLKPDVGQRGEGVAVIRSERQARDYLVANVDHVIAQRYVGGPEFGVFYYRMPGVAKGSIFSITEKVLPELTGDGRRTVERLVLDDDRAVALARHYLKVNSHRLNEVPREGERIQLVELGTHCRGAVFLDGNRFASDALAAKLDTVLQSYDGFCFGRFDVRAESDEALREGRGFKILELNGVSSESTDIYDPKNSIFAGWAKLCRQWGLAFEIGAANRELGAPVPRLRDIFAVIRGHRARQPFEASELDLSSPSECGIQ